MTLELTPEELETLLEALELAKSYFHKEAEEKFAPADGTYQADCRKLASNISFIEYKIEQAGF